MSIVSVQPKSFILALFIRDDNERFLLGDNGYDFKDSQLHFAANTIENDEVQKQGADGVMVAGQVRRASVQSFDGFVGDATMAKETIEQMRRDFIAFFLKGHHYRVIYVDCNRNAWQRKGGYLVDAPEVKELWQIHPEYHVGLNFEDVNYYSYDEDADGNEILANLVNVPVSTEAEGGLVWDEDGAVSEDAGDIYYDTAESSASGKSIAISDATDAPLASFQLDGETSQNGTPTPSAPVAVNTTTGENVIRITDSQTMPLAMTQDTSGGGAYDADTNTYTSTSRTGVNTWAQKIRLDGNDCKISAETVFTAEFRCILSNTDVSTGAEIVALTGGTGSITLSAGDTTITNSTHATYLYISFRASNGSITAVVKNPLITMPYQVQSYEVNLGKNLFDLTDFTSSISPFTVSGTADNFTITGYSTVYYKLPQDLITFSGSWETANLNGQIKIYYTDGTDENLLSSYSGSSASGTIAKTTNSSKTPEKLKITTYSTCSLTLKNLQIEKGSQATSYAAYFTPIELCKIGNYQDYIYKSGGKWYVRKECGKVILDGVNKSFSDRYTTVSSHYRFVYADQSIPNYTFGTVAQIYCNRLIGGTIGNTYNRIECIAYNDASHRLISYISSIEDSTLAAANTWLQSNPLDIVYILATPTDTEITNEALIAQLNALLTTARTYASINNITTITPNEQGTLEISYYTEYQPMVGSGGYVWEAGGAGGPTVIMNNSIDSVSPVWTIYGPTTNPQLENATTGETIEYVGTIAQGQTLTIDMGEQTASLDGLNVISNLVGDFVQLAPGRNNIIYSVSGEAGASELGWSEIVG